MSKSQRDKGARAEREFAQLTGGHRVPLSGAVEGYEGDVICFDLKAQVKARGNGGGFSLLYRWLEGHDILAVKADRKQWLVVLPVDKFVQIMNENSSFIIE